VVPGQVYAGTDAEFEEHMELMPHHSVVHTNGPTLPSGVLLPMKPESASHPCSPLLHSHGVQIGHRVKEEQLSSSPRRVMKEERRSPPPLSEARGRILHYLAAAAPHHHPGAP
jgi:hypothetical protein